ncbi:TPA: hypothetical protein EYN98_29375 [Candidatus Poribacteria bacterium]|nr:hypothetical protein [Candidatus Poribacteria bacterium]
MKPIIFSLALLSTIFMSFSLAWSDFLPEANGAEFDLEHGEAIAGVLPSPPKIDGNLDDWKYAVWIAFDSKKDILRGHADWKGKDDISVTWSTAWDKDNFYFAAAVRDDKFTPGPDTANAWKGDCIFLYIDWENLEVAAPSGKPNFSFIKKKAKVTNFGQNPDIHLSPIAIDQPSIYIADSLMDSNSSKKNRKEHIWKGATIRNLVDKEEMSAAAIGEETGVIFIRVPASSEAETIGFKNGDVILTLNGEKCCTIDDFLGILSALTEAADHKQQIVCRVTGNPPDRDVIFHNLISAQV